MKDIKTIKKIQKLLSSVLTLFIFIGLINGFNTTIANAKTEDKLVTAELNLYDNNKNHFKTPDIKSQQYYSVSAVDKTNVINQVVNCFKNTKEMLDISSYNVQTSDLMDIIQGAFNADLITYNSYHYIDCSYLYDSNTSKVMMLKFTYSDTNAQYKERYNELKYITSKIISNITDSSMDDFTKALVIHDYLALNCKYDEENYKNNTVPLESHSAYGALVNRVAVCDGYSNAYKLLLSQVGVESELVLSDSMNHAWNLVKIDGEWYHTDVTWDDPESLTMGYVTHDYFLRNTNEFKTEDYHSWNDTAHTNLATSTKYSKAWFRSCYSEIVYNNGYYYNSFNGTLYRADETGNSQVLSEPSYQYVVSVAKYNNKLYYSSRKGIYSIDADGNNRTTVSYNGEDLLVDGLSEISFMSINLDGEITYQTTGVYTSQKTMNKAFLADGNPCVTYLGSVQDIGWMNSVEDNELCGTTGLSKRLEATKISLQNANLSGGIEYQTHVQNIGWQNWAKDGAIAGTTGQALRLEAIRIRLTGEVANNYDVYYRLHVQDYGWLGWAKDGESAGTAGYGKRAEAMEITIVKKGEAVPGDTTNCYIEKSTSVSYQTHVQDIGWQDWKADGDVSGTSGQAKRLEGIKIKLENQKVSGGIRYKTHVQNIGWQGWFQDGAIAGTTGQSLRLEAIQIELTGEMANQYDIYYRVHTQDYGWLGWAENGGQAGTAGYAKRLEAIQIVLVKKGGPAPGTTSNAFISR